MLRTLTKTAFACAYTWSGVGGDTPDMPFIVGYHRVVEDFNHSAEKSIPSMLISTRMFERHVDWLAKRFRLVSLDEIGLHLENERPFHAPTAAITFDDGYGDVYRNAFPVLKRKGIPAAIFVVTDLVGTSRLQIYDRLYLALNSRFSSPYQMMTQLLTTLSQREIEQIVQSFEQIAPIDKRVIDEMAPLTWEMLAEMQREGITIGSHTRSHTLLTQESPERAQAEVSESRKALEEKLKAPIRHFAYPDGRFNTPVVKAVNAAGYRFAYGICRRRDLQFPHLTIPRKVLWERACLNAIGRFSSAVMCCQVNWAFDSGTACEHDHQSELKQGAC